MITINLRKIQTSTAKEPFDIEIEIVNNDDQHPMSLGQGDFRVEVRPHPDSTATRDVHCGFVKNVLDGHFWNAINEKRHFFTGRRVTLSPKRVFAIKVSFKELASHPFFKQSHQFNITLLVKEAKRTFTYKWAPFPKEVPLPPQVPSPPISLGESTMLEYQGIKPFYLNPTTTNSLKLCLSGDDQNQWIDLSTTELRLNRGTMVNIEITFPEPFPAAPDLPQTSLDKIKNTFITDPTQIEVVKREKDSFITLKTHRNNDQVVLKRDIDVKLKVSLSRQGETPATPIVCEISTVLQRPAFLGHAALDFGTTNSSCAYYDPNKGAPIFPDRELSPLQLRALEGVLNSLMWELEDRTLKDVRYKVLETRLISFAQQMWARSQGNQVKSCEDIRHRLRWLQQQGVSENELGNWRSKLLVSWGLHGYNQFEAQSKKPSDVADFLARKYYECLNRVIDIDTQEDAKIFLPELEKGRQDGTLSSAILMEELKPSSTQTGEPGGDSAPRINPFQSKIKMGMAVDLNIKDAILKNAVRENLPVSAEVHNAFITGTKRGIGQREEAYFVDLKEQMFKDTYDPLATAAIKHLRTLVENFITTDGSKCLNDLVVTYPTNLSQHRRLRLKEMVQSLGVRDIDLSFDEATAGALYHVWRELLTDAFAGIDGFLARSHVRKESRLSPRTGQPEEITLYFQNILFYDMGGGTTDIALLEIGLEELTGLVREAETPNMGRYFVVRPKILGLTGRDNFAGDNVTLAVFRILKSKLATKVANLLTNPSGNFKKTDRSKAVQDTLDKFAKFNENQPDQQNSLFTQWFTPSQEDKKTGKSDTNTPVMGSGSREYEKTVKPVINTLIPTEFRYNPALQPVFFDLWKEAERIKQALSTVPAGYEQTGLPKSVAATGDKLVAAIKHLNLGLQEHELSDIQISAEEMERVIRQDIRNTFERARNLCIGEDEKSQKPELRHFIDRVILAGSSSHLRLVREEMPREILGSPFKYVGRDRQEREMPAPFKLDNHNLIFDPKESKLAVARGACLPRYFKTTRVAPQNPRLPDLLRDGISFIDFDIDNLRHYIPFSLTYSVGTTRDVLFFAGDPMNVTRRDGSKVARKIVAASEVVRCYQIENITQLDSNSEEGLYGQFDLYQAIADQAKLNKDTDKKEIEKWSNQYLFFIEFDSERNLTCWMYSNLTGNADPRYVNQPAECLDKTKMPTTALATLCERNQPEGKWVWKTNPILKCPVGVSGKELVEFNPVSPTDPVLEGRVAMRQVQDDQGGIIRFETDTGIPLWSVNLRDYPVKTPALAELRLHLELQNDNVDLKYTVYDPDLEDRGDNQKDLHEVRMSFDDRRKSLPFNPFGGDE